MIDPALTPADRIVLEVLLTDANSKGDTSTDDEELRQLTYLSTAQSSIFQPVVFTTWDYWDTSPWVRQYLLQPYVRWATTVVRSPSDVVYVTHLLILSIVGLPNLVLLFVHFSWIRAILQLLLVGFFLGPFSIISHHYVHGNGLLAPSYAWIDTLFPYLLDPMMGQTWNGFYYHHKHHHIEDNGPDDLSSTIRYQRDSFSDLALYLARFIFLIWAELPLYYVRKKRTVMGLKFFAWELSSYAFIALLAHVNLPATLTGLIIPFFLWRIAVMTNNWAQHVFVDDDDPTSSYKSSITLIDVQANRHGLNDGYHISHHLSPRRHWRDHPHAFLKSKQKYAEGGSLIFRDMDFIKLAVMVCLQRYDRLAGDCLVPIGEQRCMSKTELADMLRQKTRRFTEEEIAVKFQKKR